MGLLDKVAAEEKAIIATGVYPAKVKRVEMLSNTTTGSKGIKVVLTVFGKDDKESDVFTGYVNTVNKKGEKNPIGISFLEKLAVITGLDELPSDEELITVNNESKPCLTGWGEDRFEVALQEVEDGQYVNLNIYELFFADKSSIAERVNGDTSHKRYDLIKGKLKPKVASSGKAKAEPKEDEEESPI